MESYYSNGKLNNIKEEDLIWDGNKLFIEEAPEPNEIDWEFIHVETSKKIVARIKSQLSSFVFMAFCFMIIKTVNHIQNILIEQT